MNPYLSNSGHHLAHCSGRCFGELFGPIRDTFSVIVSATEFGHHLNHISNNLCNEFGALLEEPDGAPFWWLHQQSNGGPNEASDGARRESVGQQGRNLHGCMGDLGHHIPAAAADPSGPPPHRAGGRRRADHSQHAWRLRHTYTISCMHVHQ